MMDPRWDRRSAVFTGGRPHYSRCKVRVQAESLPKIRSPGIPTPVKRDIVIL